MNHHGRTGFFHTNRDCVYIQCPHFKKSVHRKTDCFSTHVIHIAGKFADYIDHIFGFTQNRANAVCRFKILFPHSVADALRFQHRHDAETIREMTKQCSSRRRAKLAADNTAVNRDIFQYICRCRGGNRKDSVCAFDLPAADMDRGDHHFIDCQPFHQHTNGGNVGNRIHRADFMKVDFRYGKSVRMAFRLRDQAVHCHNIFLDFRGKSKVVAYDVLDVVQSAVGVVVFMTVFMVVLVRLMVMVFVMMEVMTFFLFSIYGHNHPRSGDAAFYGRLGFENDTGNAERIQFLYKFIGVWEQLEQSRRKHVARSSHSAVKVQSLHI